MSDVHVPVHRDPDHLGAVRNIIWSDRMTDSTRDLLASSCRCLAWKNQHWQAGFLCSVVLDIMSRSIFKKKNEIKYKLTCGIFKCRCELWPVSLTRFFKLLVAQPPGVSDAQEVVLQSVQIKVRTVALRKGCAALTPAVAVLANKPALGFAADVAQSCLNEAAL